MSIRAVKNLNKKFEKNVLGSRWKVMKKCEHFDNVNTALLNELATCHEMLNFENIHFLVGELVKSSAETLLHLCNLKEAIAKYEEQVLAEKKRFNSSESFGPGILRWTEEMNQIYNLKVVDALICDLTFTKEKYDEFAKKYGN